MGALLARELGEDASKIGIIAGREESEASASAVQGFSDTLEQMKGEIAWCYYQEEDCNVLDEIRARAPVDHLVVLDSRMLDRIGDRQTMTS